MEESPEKHKGLIITLSIVIPVAVAVLFRVRVPGYNFTFLPPVYATINGLTAVLLVIALFAIRRAKVVTHRRLMKTNICLSAAFLVMYILYHMTTDPTPYGGTGAWRNIYFFILGSHILLSVAVIPMVLFTFTRALAGNFERHKALAKFTWPVWFYVAVTGVLVYLMISPYYAK